MWKTILYFDDFLKRKEKYINPSIPIVFEDVEFVSDEGLTLFTPTTRTGTRHGAYRCFKGKSPDKREFLVGFEIGGCRKHVNDPKDGNVNSTSQITITIIKDARVFPTIVYTLDTHVERDNENWRFFHNYRFTGAGKKSELIQYLKENGRDYERDGKAYFGNIPANTYLEWNDVKSVVLRLSIYAYYVAEYKDKIKQSRKSKKKKHSS
ncbi:MAG: hypothetical protein NUW37_13665 [Planctomycetes bacterium]|nr:hypothetical protein [Planctomycetota bacterium]